MLYGGLYDPIVGEIRVIHHPNMNAIAIFGYVFGAVGKNWLENVNNLEDTVGGHIWVGILCIGGGFWHIITR